MPMKRARLHHQGKLILPDDQSVYGVNSAKHSKFFGSAPDPAARRWLAPTGRHDPAGLRRASFCFSWIVRPASAARASLPWPKDTCLIPAETTILYTAGL